MHRARSLRTRESNQVFSDRLGKGSTRWIIVHRLRQSIAQRLAQQPALWPPTGVSARTLFPSRSDSNIRIEHRHLRGIVGAMLSQSRAIRTLVPRVQRFAERVETATLRLLF